MKLLTLPVAIVLSVFACASPAYSDDEQSQDITSAPVSSPSRGVIQTVAYTDGVRHQSGPRCSWTREEAIAYGVDDGVLDLGDYVFHGYRRHNCEGDTPDGLVLVPVGAADAILLPALRDYVLTQLPKPEPTLAPVREQGWLLVQVPTDFRTDPLTWQPLTATASVAAGPIPIWVTATATPVRLEFFHGDSRTSDAGKSVSCTDDEPIAEYVPAEPGACSYTYRNSSATAPNGLEFLAEFHIHWDITYITSDGDSGAIDVEPTVATLPVQVAERKIYTCYDEDCGSATPDN